MNYSVYKVSAYVFIFLFLFPIKTVFAAPSAAIQASNNAFNAPATITFSITRPDAGITSSVDFYSGQTKIGESTTHPFSFTWQNVLEGNYPIYAVVHNKLLAASSTFTVSENSGQFIAPATIAIHALPADTGNNVAKVEFFNGTTKLGEVTSAPYIYVWENVPAGTYSISAVATLDYTTNSIAVLVDKTVISTTSQAAGGYTQVVQSAPPIQSSLNAVTPSIPVATPTMSPSALIFQNLSKTLVNAVTIDNVNLRATPSISGNKIKTVQKSTIITLPQGTVLTGNSWVNATLPDGTNGWILDQYLRAINVTQVKEPSEVKRTAYVNVTKLNLRLSPFGAIITELDKGTMLSIPDTAVLSESSWIMITLPNKTSGWVLSRYLSESHSSNPSTGFQTITISGNSVNVRATPNGSVIGKVSMGMKGTIIDSTNPSWIKVIFPNGLTGYVSKAYVIQN